MRKLINRLYKANFVAFVLIVLLSCYSVIFLVTAIVVLTGLIDVNVSDSSVQMITFRKIASISFSPIIETYLFQLLPLTILKNKLKWSNLVCIIISALLFGLAHFGNIYSHISTFCIGIVLAGAFVIHREHHGVKQAFWAVVSIHILVNLSLLIIRL